ncbi:carbonic anhydrase-domain-containing protein [Mrakia frigida]|uniref:carbonic anhydrase n=1 Tax=Mrakia frigida TaxID=29902 RepID=UPI003FCC0DE1
MRITSSLLLLTISTLSSLASAQVWDHIKDGNDKGNGTFLRDLLSRNRELSAAQNATDPDAFARAIASPQRPLGVLVACSDSRLPDSLIAGQKSGELFVVRNIANLVLSTELAARASIEYAVADLQAYKVIILGHDGCGGISEGHSLAQSVIARHAGYTVAEAHNPPAVASWLETIRDMMLPILLTRRSDTPLTKRTINSDPRTVFDMNSHIFDKRGGEGLNSTEEEDLGELIIKKPGYFDASLKLGVEENVKRQVNNIADSTFIQTQWSLGHNVTVHGWVYSLSSGLIRDLGVSRCLGGSCFNAGKTDGYGDGLQ